MTILLAIDASTTYQSRTWLIEQYHTNMLSLRQIGALVSVNQQTILNWMRKHGIDRRSVSDANGNAWTDERRKIESIKARERWSNPEYKDRVRKTLRALGNNEAHRKKISDGLKMAYSQNPQLRKRIGEISKRNWRTKEYRKKRRQGAERAWRNGRYGTAKHRENMSRARQRAWRNGIYDNACFIPGTPTSIEQQVAAALDIMGIEHQPQYRPAGYSRVYDEFVPPDILIEVQGDYWHNRPGAPEKDIEKARWAKENDYRLIIIWEHEINERGAWALVMERV